MLCRRSRHGNHATLQSSRPPRRRRNHSHGATSRLCLTNHRNAARPASPRLQPGWLARAHYCTRGAHTDPKTRWRRAAELCCRNVFASWRSWEICLRSLTSSLSISCCTCSSACLACSSCCCAARSSSDAERSAAPPVPPPASAGRPAGRAARSSATGQGWAGHRRCRSSWLHGPGGV